jgi:hypothetical protein
MATLGSIKTKVAQRLLDPNFVAVSEQSVVNSINDTIEYFSDARFFFNEVMDSAFLTQQDPSFPYPADFLVPSIKDGGFVIEYSNQRWPIRKISMEQYDTMFMNNGFGIPVFYAKMANEQYQCYPIPDRNYEVIRHYLKRYDPLVNDSDTNDFTDNAARLIELWTTADLIMELRQDRDMEAYFRSRANLEQQNLLNLTQKQNAKGKLSINPL